MWKCFLEISDIFSILGWRLIRLDLSFKGFVRPVIERPDDIRHAYMLSNIAWAGTISDRSP